MRKALLLLVVLGVTGSLWAADPFIGTWKLNIDKSTRNPLEPTPKEQTKTYRQLPDGHIELTRKSTSTDGTATTFIATWPQQGGNVKILQGGEEGRSYVETLVEPGNWLITVIEEGKQISVFQKTFSEDGKTMFQKFGEYVDV